jgi:electron transfer flavoprotein-quinone oxidoreductase
MGTHYRSEDFNEEKPNRYTIIRAQYDKWFSKKVKEAGALVICETTVTDLLKDDKGRVIGVRTDREDGDIFADVVVLCDGVNSLLAQRAGFHAELKPEHVALAVKEMHFLPKDVIDARFNLKDEEGVVIEVAGTVTGGMVGTAFIYTNKDSLAVGIGCLVSDFKKSGQTPYSLLEKFKNHPSVKPLLAGSEVKEYAAHLIPEGGYKAIPKLSGDGWVICGDAGQFVNALHREGSNMALTTGRIAAETIIDLKKAGQPMSDGNLAMYRARLNDTFVMKDLKKYKDLPEVLHNNPQFFSTYPGILSKAAALWFRVDGVDKITKEKEMVQAFTKGRGIRGLLGDAWKMARAWR